jgi:hypothetical protein
MARCDWRRASEHHVHARTPRFASGGDDYLFIIIIESCKVRAIASPAAALAALASAIVVLGTRCAALCCSCVPFAHAPWLSQAVGCCSTRAATSSWGGGDWRVANSKVAFCHSFDSSCAQLLFCSCYGEVQ